MAARLHADWLTDGNPDQQWTEVPIDLDVRLLTDESGIDKGEQFTGTFVGICAHDVSGQRCHADFDYLSYIPGAS